MEGEDLLAIARNMGSSRRAPSRAANRVTMFAALIAYDTPFDASG